MMARFLVTGGAGFIGSNLVLELVRRKHSVTVLDTLATGRRDNLAGVKSAITFIRGDICQPAAVARAMRDVDFVLHHAAVVDVQASVTQPRTVAQVNIMGTVTVLAAAAAAKVKHVVFASSSAVYGNTGNRPQAETFPVQPLSPYGTTKLAGEWYCRHYSQLFRLPTTILRYFNVFGPHQRLGSGYAAAIPAFTDSFLSDTKPTIYGDGRQTRDFVAVADVVAANLQAVTHAHPPGQTYNIASGHSVTINMLTKKIAAQLEKKPAVRFKPARDGDIRFSRASVWKAQRELGFTAQQSLDEGLAHFIQWHQKSRIV